MPSPKQPSDQSKGISALLCSCYSPSRKNSRTRHASPLSIDGDAPYARINKLRNRSQMPLNTQLRLSTTTEIDIDEIGGYATILKTPIQPRKWTAEDLRVTSKTHFPARADLSLPRRMSLGRGDAAGPPRAVVNEMAPVISSNASETVNVVNSTRTNATVMKPAVTVPKTTGIPSKMPSKPVTVSKTTSFKATVDATAKRPASVMSKLPNATRKPMTNTSTLPRPARSTSTVRTPSVVSRPKNLTPAPKSTTISTAPMAKRSNVSTNVPKKIQPPKTAATKIPTTNSIPATKTTQLPKPATKIPQTATTPPKSSTTVIKPSPKSSPTSIKPSPKPSPPSSVHSQPQIDTKSTSSSSRRSSEVSSNSTSISATTSDNMAMIATVHPYNRDNTSSSGGFKIEDVTDDPKYQDDDENELEGALVEYCRIDHRNQKPVHNVCEAATVVSARGNNNNDKLLSFTQAPAVWKSSTASSVGTPRMTNIIDVEVGSMCSATSQCKCFGFRPHEWRKVCVHCKCDRSEHEIGSNQVLSVYERLGIKPSDEMAAVMKTSSRDTPGSVSHGYAWVPPGLTRLKVEEFFSQYPNHVIPRSNSLGEKYREKQLMIQLPRQDLSIAYCKNLRTPVERRIYEEFVNARNEISLDIGYVCPSLPKAAECKKCRGVLEKGDIAVTASKMGEDAVWHPACFICATCEQLLVDLTYCAREDKIFCERHYAELHKPRCSACDELIFAGEYTKAMNKDWHSDHFCCWNCDTTLTGQRYILRDENPFCIKCYEDVCANTCDECTKPIGIDSKDLSYKDKHWHEDCFLCNMCKISLVDKPFGSKNDRIFCSNCYDQAFATRCDGCNEIFRAGMKKMEYKGKQWHDTCFCCATCKVPIGTKSFIPKNEEVYCANCYEDKFATRCTKCKKVISTGGVTYKNEPWHRECFCCTNCSGSLAGQRFTSKDEKPYCANCYGDLFAKRCNACVKPITGIGGAKFISFEDRHWHNDCFICAQCTTSLVGKGFITDAADILCPECAKARLMAAHS